MPVVWSSRRAAAVSILLLSVLAPLGTFAEVIALPDGGRYDGQLKNGRLHGEGVLVWPNGDRYEGQFRNGLMHGRGVFIGAAGDRYEGQMADGSFHGEGVQVHADGSRYEGRFEQGYASGRGTMSWPEGTGYTGEFQYGSPSGQGRMTRPDGTVYQGGFQYGWEHGEGVLELPDGTRYSGRFELGRLVEGRWEDGSGDHYEGDFSDWRFSGEGSYTAADGNRYSGTFEDGALVDGLHEAPDGSHYQGELSSWMYHGEGRLVDADGRVEEGRFHYGEYQGPSTTLAGALMEGAASLVSGLFGSDDAPDAIPEVEPQALLAEQALYLQPRLLDETLERLVPERPDRIDLYAVQVAGDGSQEVFRREVEYAQALFEERFDAAGRTVTLANSRTSVDRLPMATRESLRRTLTTVAERMNPEQDILFLYLTSHGSPDHDFSIDQNGMELPDLSAAELGAMLGGLDLRYKVVVVSACFSGGFIPHLRDERTLIMTAARADRTSFGCTDENDFTDFGRALLEDGLGNSESFIAAFERAVERVRTQETQRELEHSVPQIHREPAVEAQLRAWRDQLDRG